MGNIGSFFGKSSYGRINLPPGSIWDLVGLGRSWKREVSTHLNFFNSLTDIKHCIKSAKTSVSVFVLPF